MDETDSRQVKVIIGMILSTKGLKPLFGISNSYVNSPNEKQFGWFGCGRVEHKAVLQEPGLAIPKRNYTIHLPEPMER